MKILVIEDDAALRDVYGELLEQAGYHVAKAASPQVAKDFYNDFPFHVVLSDAGFDSQSSIDSVFQLWRSFQAKGSRVIVISGESTLRQRVEDAGMVFLLKPVATQQLIHAISAP
jgi:DNA-binding response OmpR family regulator